MKLFNIFILFELFVVVYTGLYQLVEVEYDPETYHLIDGSDNVEIEKYFSMVAIPQLGIDFYIANYHKNVDKPYGSYNNKVAVDRNQNEDTQFKKGTKILVAGKKGTQKGDKVWMWGKN